MRKIQDVVQDKPLYVLNQSGYHFIVHCKIDVSLMHNAKFLESEEQLHIEHSKVAGVDIDEVGCSIEIFLNSDRIYLESGLNTLVYPINLTHEQSIEEYINDWVL